jgi:hypothetical protein
MSDEIKPTPRGTLSGMLADALASVDSKLPRMASEIIGVPAMARTMDRVSYGEPLTTGRGMTLKPREDTLNALMGAAPFAQGAKAAAPLARKGAAMAVQNALAPTSPGMAQRGAIVYHGSPHTFDKFDMGKIGTGEGAQAYGHGLYFADNPAVARSYQFIGAQTDPDALTYGGRKLESLYNGAQRKQDMAHRMPEGPAKKVAIADANAELGLWESMMTRNHPKQVIEDAMDPANGWAEQAAFAKKLDLNKFGGVNMNPGNAYKVDLPDEHIAKMLDWDKPLSQQSESVRNALGGIGSHEIKDGMSIAGGGTLKVINDPDFGPKYFLKMGDSEMRLSAGDVQNLMGTGAEGKSVYQSLKTQFGSDDKVSAHLRERGIPGIRYLDQGSRTGGAGTSNYVVFDDKLPKILERNGKSLAEQLAEKLK